MCIECCIIIISIRKFTIRYNWKQQTREALKPFGSKASRLFHAGVVLTIAKLTGKLLLSDLDQLAGNVAPDAAGFSGRQISVVALGELNAERLRNFVFHLIQCLACLRNDMLVAVSHVLHLLAVGNCIMSVFVRFMIGKLWKNFRKIIF